jgi:hypothetical protein
MEMDRLQQINRDALAAVCSYYDNKHDEYVNMVYPLNDDRANATSKIIYASSAGFAMLSAIMYFLRVCVFPAGSWNWKLPWTKWV